MLYHSMIVGATGSGKTTYASNVLARGAIDRGYPVLYYSSKPPDQDPFICTWRTNNAVAFLKKAKASAYCALFFDEAPDYCTNRADHDEFKWLVTQCRGGNWNHRTFLMAQDAAIIESLYRRNVDFLYLFRCGMATSERLAYEFDDPALKAAGKPDFPYFHYFYKQRGPGPDKRAIPAKLYDATIK